jgi:hypothetical protein
MTQDSVPEGFFPIMESLWGALPQGYAYILDLVERRVDVVLRTALEAILQDVDDGKRFKSWYLQETDGQRVSQMLIAYGERLVRRSARQDCQECCLGYQWLPSVAQFSSCWWCNPMGE